MAESVVFIGHNVGIAPDRHATPIHRTLPGIYIHAMAFDNLLKYGARHSHPSQVIGPSLGINPADWPALQSILSLSWIVIAEALATLAMGRIAISQYWRRVDAPDFPTLEDELNYFLLAIGVIIVFIVAVALLGFWSSYSITGLTIDWILLTGVAVGAFPTGARSLIVKGLVWLIRPAPSLSFRPKATDMGQTTRGIPISLAQNRANVDPFLTFFVCYGGVIVKILIAFLPLLLLLHEDIEFEIAHITICLAIGVLILIIWAFAAQATRVIQRFRSS
ncbi:MAG: hypothetical protein AAGH38_02645 [Pseudomonadota bacterium]